MIREALGAMPDRQPGIVKTQQRREWSGIYGIAASLAACLMFLATFWLIAAEVVEDQRDRLDRSISVSIHAQSFPFATALMKALTFLGSTLVIVVLIAAIAVWLFAQGRRRAALVVILASASGQIAVHSAKAILHRARPDDFPAFVHASGYSFPSGHTFSAMVTYGLLALFVAEKRRGRTRVLPWIGWIVIFALVGLSRIYLGAHYATDVLGSVLLGGLWLIATFWVLDLVERSPPAPSTGEA